MLLKWFDANCPKVKYLVKLDDDVFMNIPNVFKFLTENENRNYSIMGYYRHPEAMQRYGKWKITRQQYYDDIYPGK